MFPRTVELADAEGEIAALYESERNSMASVMQATLNVGDIALAEAFRNILGRYFDAVGATAEEDVFVIGPHLAGPTWQLAAWFRACLETQGGTFAGRIRFPVTEKDHATTKYRLFLFADATDGWRHSIILSGAQYQRRNAYLHRRPGH